MSSKNHFRLASYNVRKCVGLDRRRRPGRIVDVLNSLDADVIALQEADRRLGDRPAALPANLIEAHTDFQFVTLPGNGASVGWHGNAVLVKSGLEILRSIPLDLPGTEPRGALSVELSNGFRLVATHLGLLRRDRRRQMARICEIFGDDCMATAIIGDFNEWSESRGLEPLAKNFELLSPGNSFHSARPVAALDRIATNSLLQITGAGVTETKLSKIASDHLPIWADIKLNRSNTAPLA
ncbi:MAG: endonuclease/exonuclease/phosphatase family protein [Paracoccaceae bacterium]